MGLFGIPGTDPIERRLNNAVDNLIGQGERAVGNFVRDLFDGDDGGGDKADGGEETTEANSANRPRKAGARLYVVRLADLDNMARILAWGIAWVDVNGPVRIALAVDGIEGPVLLSGAERLTEERLVMFEASGSGIEIDGIYSPSDLTPNGSGLVRLPDSGGSWPVVWTASFRGSGPMPTDVLGWFRDNVLTVDADERDERVAEDIPYQFDSNPLARAAGWMWEHKGSILTAVATATGLIAAFRAR